MSESGTPAEFRTCKESLNVIYIALVTDSTYLNVISGCLKAMKLPVPFRPSSGGCGVGVGVGTIEVVVVVAV